MRKETVRTKDSTSDPFVIRADEVYPLAEAIRRSGMGKQAIQAARRRSNNPLKIRYCGRIAFIFGRDLIDYLESCPTSRTNGEAIR